MKYLEKITDQIYAHTEGKTIGNVGVIATETGNFVVDTSMYPVMAREIRNEVGSIHTGNIRGAILTHYHFDHSGGNQVFHDVGIYGHKLVKQNLLNFYDEDQMRHNIDQRDDTELFEDFSLTAPTIVFETNPYHPADSEVIEVYQVGGHTSGSSIIYFQSENAVFAGDNLFAGLFPWGGDPTSSPYEWLAGTNFLLDRSPDIVVPGHGPVQFNLKEVEDLRAYLTNIIHTGEKLVEEGIEKERAIEVLLEIDSKPEKNEGMKLKTLEHWFNVIAEH